MRFSHVTEAIAQAAGSLRANPLRAMLGALAIAVAVATIVVVVTALDGVARYARTTSARAFGSDTFVLAQVASPGRVSRRALERQLDRNPPVRRSDVRAIDRLTAGAVLYAPSAQTTAQVAAGARTFDNGAITGTAADLAGIRDLGIVRGRFLNEDEERRGAQVAVIGADVAERLFPGQDPIGRPLRVAGRRFAVIGLQQKLGTSGGASLDRYVWIPLIAYERAFGAPATLQVFARGSAGVATDAAEGLARTAMRARRHLGPGEDDTFDVLTPDAARGFVLNLSNRIGAAAGPISLMALLAAVVVITNTVLVSVTERTREIGVRRALGAPRGQIMREVLAESTLVSLIGGVAGVLVVLLLTAGLSRALEIALPVRWSTVAWAVLASAASGLAAGWYPARRATRIDVMAAVRAE